MNKVFPTLFVSHGAPTMAIEDCPTRRFFQQLGREVGRPRAIVCISAHWTTSEPRVTMNAKPATIHDFGGFPEELYRLNYPAPGDPVLAERVLSLLGFRAIAGEGDLIRGFDHGAWSPLMLIYPDAGIPVVQLSVQPQLGPEHHLAMGRALQPLRDEEVLVMASGSATHDLRGFFGHELNAEPLSYARQFAEWLKEKVVTGNIEELLDYQSRAPHGLQNHPTPEHFLPLFVALGAGGTAGRVLHDAYTYGALSMAAFGW